MMQQWMGGILELLCWQQQIGDDAAHRQEPNTAITIHDGTASTGARGDDECPFSSEPKCPLWAWLH